jgi:hypothetical protein
MVRFVGANDCIGETAIVRGWLASMITEDKTNNADTKM